MRYGWLLCFTLAACGAPATDPVTQAQDAVADTTPVAVVPATPVEPPPAPPPTAAPDSPEAAADIVRRYHRLIADRDYDAARGLWESGAEADGFAEGVRGYEGYRASVGAPGRVDAGAGQRYVTVPFTIRATRSGGGTVDLTGTATLHRVGDIDGATPEQRRWRIRSIDLTPRTADGGGPTG